MIKKIVTTRFVDEDSEQEFQFEPVEGTVSIEQAGKGRQERGTLFLFSNISR